MDDTITVSDFLDAQTFVTTVDGYILLRIRTSAEPDIWLRMSRDNYAGFAAFLSSDARQLTVDH